MAGRGGQAGRQAGKKRGEGKGRALFILHHSLVYTHATVVERRVESGVWIEWAS